MQFQVCTANMLAYLRIFMCCYWRDVFASQVYYIYFAQNGDIQANSLPTEDHIVYVSR